MGPPGRIDPTIHRTMSERSYHGATYRPECGAHMINVSLIRIGVYTYQSPGKTHANGQTLGIEFVRDKNLY